MNLTNITTGALKRAPIDELFIGIEKYLNGTGTEAENEATLKRAKGIQDYYLKSGDSEACQAFTEVFNTICKREGSASVIAPVTEKKSKKSQLLEIFRLESAGKTIYYNRETLALRVNTTPSNISGCLSEFKAKGKIEYSRDNNTITLRDIGD